MPPVEATSDTAIDDSRNSRLLFGGSELARHSPVVGDHNQTLLSVGFCQCHGAGSAGGLRFELQLAIEEHAGALKDLIKAASDPAAVRVDRQHIGRTAGTSARDGPFPLACHTLDVAHPLALRHGSGKDCPCGEQECPNRHLSPEQVPHIVLSSRRDWLVAASGGIGSNSSKPPMTQRSREDIVVSRNGRAQYGLLHDASSIIHGTAGTRRRDRRGRRFIGVPGALSAYPTISSLALPHKALLIAD